MGHGSVSTIRPNWKNWVGALQLQQHIAETAESAGLGGRPSPMPVGRKPRSRPKWPGLKVRGKVEGRRQAIGRMATG